MNLIDFRDLYWSLSTNWTRCLLDMAKVLVAHIVQVPQKKAQDID
jgi:hypothetical protein